MLRKNFLITSYIITGFVYFIVLALASVNIEDPALIWVAPVSESLFITGSSILVYVMLSRGLLSNDKFLISLGLSFLITIIPTFFWLLTWHNVEGQSFIPTLPSTHIWFLYIRDTLFIVTFLILLTLFSRFKLDVRKTFIFLLLLSFIVCLFILQTEYLPPLIINNSYLSLNRIISLFVLFLYIIAIAKTLVLFRQKKHGMALSFSFFLIIYSAGYLSYAISDSRFDIGWLFGKADNLFAFGVLITALMIEYTDYFVQSLVAKSIQDSFRPDLPQLNWLEIDAEYRPSFKQATIGGDWYDILLLNEREIILIVGDAIGKGISAISTMTEAKFLLRGFLQEGRSLSESLNSLNKYLNKYLANDEFVTIAVVKIEKENPAIEYALAGHPFPLIISNEGWHEVDTPETRPPLGISPVNDYISFHATLKKNDILCIFSDGVLEARRDGELFGESNLGRSVMENTSKNLKYINLDLLESMQKKWQIVDDLTIILARKLI